MIKDSGESWDVDLLSNLRAADMSLAHLANIFKLYHAEMQIAQALEDPTPETPQHTAPLAKNSLDRVQRKGRMIYHLFKSGVTDMTPEQKFHHAVTVRNRTYGPKEAVTVSPHLDVEMTESNKRFLRISPEDTGMFNVLRESTCRHGDNVRLPSAH